MDKYGLIEAAQFLGVIGFMFLVCAIVGELGRVKARKARIAARRKK